MAVDIDRINCRNQHILETLQQTLFDAMKLAPVSHGKADAFLTYEILSGKEESLMAVLNNAGINASLIGKQYAHWALEKRGLNNLLRFTPHYITAESELEKLLVTMKECRRFFP